MVFADTYRIYCYIKDFLTLSKEEEEVFEFISSVRNIEDLFEVLKNNKLSLSDLIENSVAFALKDDYDNSVFTDGFIRLDQKNQNITFDYFNYEELEDLDEKGYTGAGLK